jgi:hypothetical protein
VENNYLNVFLNKKYFIKTLYILKRLLFELLLVEASLRYQYLSTCDDVTGHQIVP